MPAPCCSGRGGRLAHRSRSSLHLALRREKPWPKELFLRICQNSASWGDLRLPACVLTAGQSGSISVTWNGARRCADALPGAARRPPPPSPAGLCPSAGRGLATRPPRCCFPSPCRVPAPCGSHREGPRGRCPAGSPRLVSGPGRSQSVFRTLCLNGMRESKNSTSRHLRGALN